ncbi:hypothetical protein [Rosenbergiella epipactidis]|uniref:hypothetical protein n=1 Tax=Rosenbergiella epipactidis TaxID=1544694 RepID=UPI001F4DF620|nr:hypothetical protein [Rosenbergiella epipactidis]
MAKFTNVHDLLVSYQGQYRKIPAKGVYASKERRDELQASHARKVHRKRKRSVGKSNKLGFRFSAEIRTAMICEANFLAMVCRESKNNFRGK